MNRQTTKWLNRRYSFPLRTILGAWLLLGCVEKDSPQRTAMQIVKRSLEASGDLADKSLKVSVGVIANEGRNRGQSYRPDPPYNTFKIETRFQIDRPNGVEKSMSINPFNGFLFQSATVLDSSGGRTYDYLSRTYHASQTTGFERYRHFPHRYLVEAMRDSSRLTYEGLQQLADDQVHVVTVNGEFKTRLFFRVQDLLLKKIEREISNHPYGNGLLVKEFSVYRRFGGVKLPQRIKSGGIYDSWGTLFNDYEVALLTDDIRIPEKDENFRFLLGDNPAISLVELAKDIYLVRNVNNDKLGTGDYNVLVVRFEDFLLVGEAPVSNDVSLKVLALLNQEFDGLEVKYLVQSHHHQDHIGGIREYIARQVSLVVPKDSKALYQRVSSADWSRHPDTLFKNPQRPKFVLVDQSHTIQDDRNLAHVINIGPIPHVQDMLAIYFPKQKLLWQADMIAYKAWPLDLEPSRILKDRIRKFGWELNMIAGEHGEVLAGPELLGYLRD